MNLVSSRTTTFSARPPRRFVLNLCSAMYPPLHGRSALDTPTNPHPDTDTDTDTDNENNRLFGFHGTQGAYNHDPFSCRLYGGGASATKTFAWSQLAPYVELEMAGSIPMGFERYELVRYGLRGSQAEVEEDHEHAFYVEVPLSVLTPHLLATELKTVSRFHGLKVARGDSKSVLGERLSKHVCLDCGPLGAFFVPLQAATELKGASLRQEYVDSMSKKVKAFSFAEISTFASIPEASHEAYKLGARLDTLRPTTVDAPSNMTLMQADSFIAWNVPWMAIASKGSKPVITFLASMHGVVLPPRVSRVDALDLMGKHNCVSCPSYTAVFRPFTDPDSRRSGAPFVVDTNLHANPPVSHFPPPPISEARHIDIVREFCEELRPDCIEETGCAVCGQLKLLSDLTPLDSIDCSLSPLEEPNVVRLERSSSDELIQYASGPVLDRTLNRACSSCIANLKKGRRPLNALANGLWLGQVPDVLSSLSYVEQLLVARVRTNRCVLRVSSGQTKMVANAITFACPTLKVYRLLPPPKPELEEVLAFIYTGPSPPTEADLGRTPMLVRRNKVANALRWLKLNHSDYADLSIDYTALQSYPECGIPVNIVYRTVEDGSNAVVAATSMHETDDSDEVGAATGDCPFKVNGLVGGDLEDMSLTARRAAAVHHLRTGGHVLSVGRSESAESMYDNPQLYPQTHPWLFPYGSGGLGTARLRGMMSESSQKKWMLMYHDKRFQRDSRFVLLAFNHEQIKRGTVGSQILAKRANFSSIVSKVAQLNPAVLSNLVNRLKEGESVTPQTDDEKICFSIMDQIEHVATNIYGSMASKKRMRNELWSLVTYQGAPSWFVTLSPVDNKHPICLYWADTQITFNPDLSREYCERARLIAKNPVAGARFFHFLVQLLIKHLLRWSDSKDRSGIFGRTSAFYGTVEQQGQLTLHLHMLIWIVCALSPQQVRDRLMSKDAEFTSGLVTYLESCQTGEYLTGTNDDIKSKLCTPEGKYRAGAPDPTQELPVPPPATECIDFRSCRCSECASIARWVEQYKDRVDNVIYRSNRHRCFTRRDVVVDGVHKQHVSGKGCINKDGVCTARFPREIFLKTVVDKDGHINLKKLEAWLNTVNETMVYCYGCNTDCTSLNSGTAVKATVGYVADYIVKMGLKTYEIFSSIYDVFERHTDVWSDSKSNSDAARRLIMKMANSLTSKVEIGAPMAAMYLLGNPDHYTSHSFVPFYWRAYVTHVLNSWDDAMNYIEESEGVEKDNLLSHSSFAAPSVDEPDVDDEPDPDPSKVEKVMISRWGNSIMSRSNVDDYKMRPTELSNVCLFDWVQCSIRRYVGNRKNILDRYLCYEAGHPLRETHRIEYDINRVLTVVPNFLGGYLPRPDGDDREHYCCTILTFFSPWRQGLDLKSSGETWASAFERHSFSERHLKIVDNMKIRFECYDARDDYHAQLKLRTAAQLNGDEGNESDDDELIPPEDDELEEVDADTLGDEGLLGDWTRKRRDQMKDAELALYDAGWVAHTAGSALAGNQQPVFRPERTLSASKWKEIVAETRASILSSRLAGIPNMQHLQDDMDIDVIPLNDARVIPGSYLLYDFKVTCSDIQQNLQYVVSDLTLNSEQERAFRIIAQHSVSVNEEPLRMYIGGMGGTGKTQVIKALRHWFNRTGESYRMAVLAPTGAAASVVDGSTYHSFLGVNTGERRTYFGEGSTKTLDDARIRMRGVDYIFLDEVSMVSCQDMFLIDARLKEITKTYDVAFGGINVVVAGDFAQLPPAHGFTLYSGEVSKVQLARQVQSDQESTLGMMLWHQFVTVVILVKNMRQQGTTEKDDALRDALEHMRYRDCTPEDVAFLKTLVPAFNKHLNIGDAVFRDVSVITAWNSHKDQFNDMNSTRFADENKQPLFTFYSMDKPSVVAPDGCGRGRGRGRARGRGRGRGRGQGAGADAASNMPRIRLTPAVQESLWHSPPHTSEHVAGSLTLCIGMPVMIRNNDATELSITKGQEAVVKGWTCHEIPNHPGRFALDILFVELVNTKRKIKVPYLDENIVPLTPTTTSLKAILPNDRTMRITRRQVPVLLNFAMTDYASQGKTRSVNVVDLKRSKNHQAVYTALSRGTSAETTVILRDFNESKITGGISGFLRQEFRELELLDEATKLQFEGRLPLGVVQNMRSSTLASFRRWKATSESIARVPRLAPNGEPHPNEAGSISPLNAESREVGSAKRKADMLESVTGEDAPGMHSKKKRFSDVVASQPASSAPWTVSWKWDSVDWSCAYDSYLTILRYIYASTPPEVSDSIVGYGFYMDYLFESFSAVERCAMTLDECRLGLRERMWALDPIHFPRGPVGTDLYGLVQVVSGLRLQHEDNLSMEVCGQCRSSAREWIYKSIGKYMIMRSDLSTPASVARYLQDLERPVRPCARCGGEVYLANEYPPLLSLQLPQTSFDVVRTHLVIDSVVSLRHAQYKLSGVVYWSGADNHFASRVIHSSETVYQYDGMQLGGIMRRDRVSTERALSHLEHKTPSLAVYVRVA